MAEAKHTPGPWLIDWGVSRLDVHADGRRLVTIPRSTKDGAPTYDDSEAIANARLIASAPELLAALEAARLALDAISDEMTVGDRFTNAGQHLLDALMPARAAIAKATS